MPEEIARSSTGVRGVFPFRFPVGKFLALVSFLLFIPVWWTVGEMATPRIKTYYAKTYWQTLTDGWTLAPGGLPKRGVYRVLAVGPVSSPLLATQVTLDSVKDIREQWVELESKAFHKWLSDNIYQGAELSIYYLFAGCVVVSGLALFWSGAEWDWRRRDRAIQGTHRRGTRFMPWRRFNRGQLGPLWLLWCRNFWLRRLSQPALLEAARRGRRMGATGQCYLAATQRKREKVAAALGQWVAPMLAGRGACHSLAGLALARRGRTGDFFPGRALRACCYLGGVAGLPSQHFRWNRAWQVHADSGTALSD